MSVRVERIGPDMTVYASDVQKDTKRVIAESVEAMVEVASNAGDEMQYIISTTPSSIVPGKPNRIDTGNMIESVEVSDPTSNGDVYSVSFGWIDNWEDYFGVQDKGGKPVGLFKRGVNRISPMHAIAGAGIQADQQMEEKIRKILS